MPGRYCDCNFPANTTLSVSPNTITLTAGGPGTPDSLTVDNDYFAPLIKDTLSEAELSLGARLNTTGNGGSYADALYSGTTVLRVDYYEPDVAGLVFKT